MRNSAELDFDLTGVLVINRPTQWPTCRPWVVQNWSWARCGRHKGTSSLQGWLPSSSQPQVPALQLQGLLWAPAVYWFTSTKLLISTNVTILVCASLIQVEQDSFLSRINNFPWHEFHFHPFLSSTIFLFYLLGQSDILRKALLHV